ncbi:MAG: 8-oxo-dGTP diphosphatase MutT [Alicyclobacillus sp.]|nr:8-oxo-dGTP diphosphatase MutT [Alicyclobacillus sp.]
MCRFDNEQEVSSLKQVHVVGAVIVNDKQEILCALRSKSMSLGGLWEFPGGKIEAGETPQEALTREIQEELGCIIEVGDFVATCTYDYPNVRVQLDTYFARLVEGTPKANEHERLEWIPRTQLRSLEWAPADVPTVNRLVE